MKRKGLVIALSVLALLLVPLTASATNAWSKYHWERTETDAAGEPLPLALTFGDNVWTRWDDHLGDATADWNASAVLSNAVVAGAATNPTTTCTPTTGNVEVCAQDYGANGWLGVAGIWITRGKDKHITRGYVKLNDYYFNQTKYDTADCRQLVTCQEVGHTFGRRRQSRMALTTPSRTSTTSINSSRSTTDTTSVTGVATTAMAGTAVDHRPDGAGAMAMATGPGLITVNSDGPSTPILMDARTYSSLTCPTERS